MCIHPILMTSQGRVLERRVDEKTSSLRGICEYAFKGCEGAKDGETYKRYCQNNGEFCPSKFCRAMEESE